MADEERYLSPALARQIAEDLAEWQRDQRRRRCPCGGQLSFAGDRWRCGVCLVVWDNIPPK